MVVKCFKKPLFSDKIISSDSITLIENNDTVFYTSSNTEVIASSFTLLVSTVDTSMNFHLDGKFDPIIQSIRII